MSGDLLLRVCKGGCPGLSVSNCSGCNGPRRRSWGGASFHLLQVRGVVSEGRTDPGRAPRGGVISGGWKYPPRRDCRVRGVPGKRPGPGYSERGRLHPVEKPFESPPPPTPAYTRRWWPAPGREEAGPANFKPPVCPSLPAPQGRLCTVRKRPFSRCRPDLPSTRARSPQTPSGSPSGTLFPGQGSGRHTFIPWGSLPASRSE